MDKVPREQTYLDFSDYARPAARWLVRHLLPTRVTPVHLTLAYTMVGSAAALLLARDRWLPVAGVLLLVKSMLDGADGSLARERRRPSRVGRFLDSVCDFVVMALVFAGIAANMQARTGQVEHWALAAAALLCATLQGTIYSYYSVRHRAQTGGDQTSHLHEVHPAGFAWDPPAVLAPLYRLYRLIYAWQDELVDRLDHWASPAQERLRPAFLTATSVLGLGTQLLIIAVCAFAGRPVWALWLFVTVFNIYGLALILVRRLTSRASNAHHFTRSFDNDPTDL